MKHRTVLSPDPVEPSADDALPARMSRVNPILEKETLTKLSQYSRDGWSLVECLETNFVFLQDPPYHESFSAVYAWEKTSLAAQEERYTVEPLRAQFSRVIKQLRAQLNRGQKVVNESLKILSKRGGEKSFRVLDVGCADGRYGVGVAYHGLYQYGFDIEPIGIEISDYLAEVSRGRMEKFGGHVIHKPAIEGMEEIQDHSLDLIIMISFLEHEIQPAALLRLCSQKLTKSGRILLKVPNFDSLNRKMRGEKWCGFRFPDHVNYFTPKTLKMLVMRTGLKIERCNMLDRATTNDNMWAVISRAF